MATLAFAAAAQTYGWGQFATMVATTAGSIIDSTVVMPALFPQRSEQGKLGDEPFRMAEEGSPMAFMVGPTVRVPGVVIWKSRLIEVQKTDDVGGKGGGGAEVTTFEYFVDVAVAVGEGPINKVSKVWANAKKIYDDNPDVTITSTLLAVAKTTVVNSSWQGGGTTVYMDVSSPTSTGPDLTKLKSGRDVVVTNFATGANNGTFRCNKVWKDAVAAKTYVRLENALVVAEAAGANATLFQDLPQLKKNVAKSITLHLGTPTDAVDPLIESYEGMGLVPRFKNVAYVVFERLNLTKYFGNVMPTMSFLVEKTATRTVGEAIGDFMLDSGLVAADYEVAAASEAVRGYARMGPEATAQALQPLFLAYGIASQHDGTKVRFFPRKDATEVVIPAADVAAHSPGSSTPRPFQVRDVSDVGLPSLVNVKYIDPVTDYDGAEQAHRRRNVAAESIMDVSVDLVLTGAEARCLAVETLWTAWANRQPVDVQLPPSWISLKDGSRLVVVGMGETWTLFVNKVEIGRDWIVRAECAVEETGILDFTNCDAEDPIEQSGLPELGDLSDLDSQIIDIAPLRAGDAVIPMVYWGSARTTTTSTHWWSGTALYESTNGGLSYQQVDFSQLELPFGRADTALASGVVNYWDEKSTVDVTMSAVTLIGYTELEVLNGKNRMLVGEEIIAFQNVTVLDATNKRYRLSRLIRGLAGTADQVGTHLVGERAVMLNQPGIEPYEMTSAAINSSRVYKFIPGGGDPAGSVYPSVAATILCATVRPFPPTDAKSAWDPGTNDRTISWKRVTRQPTRIFSQQGAPDVEPSETYDLVLFTKGSGFATVSKTYSNIAGSGGSASKVVPSADVTAAGYTTSNQNDKLDLKIYQVGQLWGGRGKELKVNV